jgi:hydrogenase nickel incorporation protein HypA/HybF
MHELALSQNIVNMVVEAARLEGVRRVSGVMVEIGAAAGVEPEALRFCFDVTAEQTIAEGAALTIVPIALRARCRGCAREFVPSSLIAPCPHCASHDRELLAGRELRVKSFDAE